MRNEEMVAFAFSRQSFVFDSVYGKDRIIAYKRKRVYNHAESFLAPCSCILELNAGTGEDALYFASQAHHVHATDISDGMMKILQEKCRRSGLDKTISMELCSYHQLAHLENQGPFDHIFSNFGGLNCSPHLKEVLHSADRLLKPGGVMTLVIISRFCLWESLLVFRGKFRTAFRRMFSSKGQNAHVEGQFFRCWYYSSRDVRKALKNYEVLRTEALCLTVPPSYIQGFAEKHPQWFGGLVMIEEKIKSWWPFRNWGDYFIISLRKPSGA